MGSLILIKVATNESWPLSVVEIVNEYLAQPVETVEDGNSDQDQVPDTHITTITKWSWRGNWNPE